MGRILRLNDGSCHTVGSTDNLLTLIEEKMGSEICDALTTSHPIFKANNLSKIAALEAELRSYESTCESYVEDLFKIRDLLRPLLQLNNQKARDIGNKITEFIDYIT